MITQAKPGMGLKPAPGAEMFTCGSLMTSDCVLANLRASNKKQVLQELARKAAKLTGQDEQAIYEVLNERELLGTTGIGHGIAIRTASCRD